MSNHSWESKIDAYVDAELPADEMRAMADHVRDCPSCATEALRRTEVKRAVRFAAQKFKPSADFRRRLRAQVAPPKRSLRRRLLVPSLAIAALLIVAAFLALSYSSRQRQRGQLLAQVVDLHIADLAAANPVDVVSSDRHTVKPWFQGKLPFTFNLPEFQGTRFTLVGGRVSYLAHSPGAELIVDVRKHHISVFIFQDGTQFQRLLGAREAQGRPASFLVDTWTAGGLRYFIVTDAAEEDVRALKSLFRTAAES